MYRDAHRLEWHHPARRRLAPQRRIVHRLGPEQHNESPCARPVFCARAGLLRARRTSRPPVRSMLHDPWTSKPGLWPRERTIESNQLSGASTADGCQCDMQARVPS